MDFTGRDGLYDDQDHINRSTTHFPFSSSSSPQYRGFFPLSNNAGRTVDFHVQDEEELALASAATTATTSGGAAPMIIEKEHMFDKVVTPSDVGKLNRLVIPKQHAEKYFPLDSTTNEKGLLLNFEDRTGKPWRFRYSYWNSSQSYVMTKGWSRFVKEKKLDAGDIVSFQRGVGEEAKDRLYIDWRRRQNAHPQFDHHQQTSSGIGFHRSNVPWSPLFLRQPHGAVVQFSQQPHNFVNSYQYPNPNQNQNRYNHYYYSNNNVNPCPGSIIYLRSAATQVQESGGNNNGGGGENRVVNVEPMVFDSVPVVHGTSTKTVSKKLRLFGVNMECGVSSETSLQQDESNGAIMMEAHHESSNIPFTTLESTRLYNGIPVQTDHHQFLINNKGKSSSNSMSLDLDI